MAPVSARRKLAACTRRKAMPEVQGVSSIASSSMGALWHKKHASTGTFCDSRGAQEAVQETCNWVSLCSSSVKTVPCRAVVLPYYLTNISFLYSFFWAIPRRLNIMCRRFGPLFHLHTSCEQNPVHTPYEDGTDRMFRNVGR